MDTPLRSTKRFNLCARTNRSSKVRQPKRAPGKASVARSRFPATGLRTARLLLLMWRAQPRAWATECKLGGGWVLAVEADGPASEQRNGGEVGPIEPRPLIVSATRGRGDPPCRQRVARRATRARYRPSWIDFLGYPGLRRLCSGLGGPSSGLTPSPDPCKPLVAGRY
jgi:hypothetical protein